MNLRLPHFTEVEFGVRFTNPWAGFLIGAVSSSPRTWQIDVFVDSSMQTKNVTGHGDLPCSCLPSMFPGGRRSVDTFALYCETSGVLPTLEDSVLWCFLLGQHLPCSQSVLDSYLMIELVAWISLADTFCVVDNILRKTLFFESGHSHHHFCAVCVSFVADVPVHSLGKSGGRSGRTPSRATWQIRRFTQCARAKGSSP